mmetsp:Transcript_3727/g.4893  ORF Transcript_3727/g.4893 Transcript_3727/m.4893 type:complete len:168 (-) Transcript_3727:201-704(-)
MGETRIKQRSMKLKMDEKLTFSRPTNELLNCLKVECSTNKSSDNTFQYAFTLAKSNDPKDLRYAVDLLNGLLMGGYEHQIDCMYGIAQAMYLLEDYEGARVQCEAILRSYPDNRDTKELHLASIEGQQLKKDEKVKKAAVAGSIVLGAGGIALGVTGMLLGKKKKRR